MNRPIDQALNLTYFPFPFWMWLSSRCLILLALGIAPLLPAPPGGIQPEMGWGTFSAWDSPQYEQIVTSGYSSTDQIEARVAFFPLFPLLIRIGMEGGLSFEMAGTLINNFSFLVALIFLYQWVSKTHTMSTARWATAVLAWCPFSLFGTVIYTEGLFLGLSTIALYTYHCRNYPVAAIFGALATATRVTGLALIPTFFLVAWKEKRSPAAYLTGLVSSLGIVSYSIYCGWKFHQPFAFIIVQKKFWQPQQDFWGQGWIKMIAQVTIGTLNWKAGHLVDFWHPLIFVLVCIFSYGIWRYRNQLGEAKVCYLSFGLIVGFWLLAGNPFINMTICLGGLYLLGLQRQSMGRLSFLYGLISFAILLSSGRTVSAERYVYGIVSLSIALGLALERHPRWGYSTLSFFALLLALFSIRFAQHLWVA